MSKKHYHNDLAYETKPHFTTKAEKNLRIHKLQLIKAICKVGAGVGVLAPLNAPFGFVPVITSCAAWAAYVALEYVIHDIKSGWETKKHFWIY